MTRKIPEAHKKILIEEKGQQIIIQVEYTARRRTVSITVKGRDEIVVRAPARIADRELKNIVRGKFNWIQGKRQMWQQRENLQTGRNWTDGEKILVQGTRYKLSIKLIEDITEAAISITGNEIIVLTPVIEKEFLRQAVLSWYLTLAKDNIIQRVGYYASLMGTRSGTVRVKNHKSRWGSCTARNDLNFNWRLIMAPENIMDYVIIHELCHIKVKNHSATFWNLVKKFEPEYNSRRRWLRENGHLLEI